MMPSEAVGSSPLDSFVRQGVGTGTITGVGLLLLAFPVIVFGPIGEELAFRGLLQPALSRWLSPAAAVGVTAVLFGSMHWYYGVMVPLAVFFGVVLGWARHVSGGLRAPILIHMSINAVWFLAMVART